MSTNKSISYLLYNKGILVNLYKLYLLFSYFFFFNQAKEFFTFSLFHLPFSPLQLNTCKKKSNFFILLLFYFSNQTDLNLPWKWWRPNQGDHTYHWSDIILTFKFILMNNENISWSKHCGTVAWADKERKHRRKQNYTCSQSWPTRH